MSALHRALRRCMGTLLGRIVLGPVYCAAIALRGLGVALVKRDRIALRHWAAHGAALAALFWWLTQVCGIPLLDYVLLFAWPGAGLAQIRSFAEHRAAPDALARTAVVEAGGLMSFLFLYNNLHALHHAEPGLAWHRRPAEYRRRRPEILALSHYHLIPGYAFLFRNYLLDAKEPLLHPGMARRSVARPATQTPGPASEALAPAS
jgi:fatty acid desaturase